MNTLFNFNLKPNKYILNNNNDYNINYSKNKTLDEN